MNHVSPQGGSISRLYPTCYNTKVYTGGIYIVFIQCCSGMDGCMKGLCMYRKEDIFD